MQVRTPVPSWKGHVSPGSLIFFPLLQAVEKQYVLLVVTAWLDKYIIFDD
jgi:hypothetical protein